jgi:hypothetical protein
MAPFARTHTHTLSLPALSCTSYMFIWSALLGKGPELFHVVASTEEKLYLVQPSRCPWFSPKVRADIGGITCIAPIKPVAHDTGRHQWLGPCMRDLLYRRVIRAEHFIFWSVVVPA